MVTQHTKLSIAAGIALVLILAVILLWPHNPRAPEQQNASVPAPARPVTTPPFHFDFNDSKGKPLSGDIRWNYELKHFQINTEGTNGDWQVLSGSPYDTYISISDGHFASWARIKTAVILGKCKPAPLRYNDILCENETNN